MEGMQTSHRPQTTTQLDQGGVRPGGTTLLLLGLEDPRQLVARPNRHWDRLLSRLLAPRLDRQLVEGQAPESTRLLAARAQYLVRPATRRELARNWLHLMARADARPAGRSSRIPLRRAGIAACEQEIRALAGSLSRPLPCAAAGVAEATRLLTDGTGPLFQHRHPRELRAALLKVLARLDPEAPL
jgi:hypothetical protein